MPKDPHTEPAPGRPPTRRTVGPGLYLLLALALGGMVVLSLLVNEHVSRAIERVVAVNEVWAPKFGVVSVLGGLATAVDAPGNDIFLREMVGPGRAEMRAAYDSFQVHLAEARVLVPEGLLPRDSALMIHDLNRVDSSMRLVVLEGEELFRVFARERSTAIRRMARMDEAYAGSLRGLRTLRGDLGAVQDKLILANRHDSAVNSQLLRFAGLLMFLLAAGGGFLGLRLAREAERQALERDRTMDLVAAGQAQLEVAHAGLTAAHQELESFSYSVAHDLRAPLRSIYGFSQALAEDASDRLDPVSMEHLVKIRAASVRMGELIDDLLTISRVTRHTLRVTPVDMSAMAQEVVDELRASEPDRKVSIEITPGLRATADATLVRILLQNLLGNAWKFTRRTADARIHFGQDRSVPSRHAPTFLVRDNGAGFDATYATKLFQAFQRLHTSAEFEGTGIGLATVRRVVNRHGGAVWAEGRVGTGATFWFTLEK